MVIFNEAKPKYERLDELLSSYLMDIRFTNSVNIIIDLKDLLKKFFRPDIVEENYSKKALIEEISSDVLNLIGHYRNYFYKKGKYTNFYFLYSKNKCEKLISKLPGYKKDYYEKYFNQEDSRVDIINRVVQVVEKISEIVPHSLFIDTSEFDEFIFAKYITTTANKNELNVILTNDNIFYQLLGPNIVALTMKGIKSEIITSKNAIKYITKKDDYNFSSNLLPLVFAMGGYKKYSLDGINGYALVKACNIIEHLINKEKIKDTDSIKVPIEFSELDITNKLEKVLIENKEKISSNYSLVRLDEFFHANKILIGSVFIRKTKVGGITYFKDLNSKVFTNFPLQIEMILRGEKL